MKHLLEICCSGLEACLLTQRNGGDRIELCGSMAAGGLTPSMGLFQLVKKQCSLPVAVMIRPRGAGFCYNEEEVITMKEDAALFLEKGAAAIVFGFLNKDKTVDQARVKEFCDLAHSFGKEAVFHRAIDETKDILKEIIVLASLGVDRVLTAGGSGNASDHLKILQMINEQIVQQMQVIICGGIRSHNLQYLIQSTKVTQIHSAARTMRQDPSMDPEIELSYENAYDSVDGEEVKAMAMQINEMQ